MANTTGIKFGGRKKGTPNRTTKETREALKKIIDDELEYLPQLLQSMKPYQRADVLTKLIQYVLPKPENSLDINEKLNEVHVLPEWLTTTIDIN
jgi:hypothetical protein